MQQLTTDLATWASKESGITYVTSVALRAPSGRLIELGTLAQHERVDCSSLFALRATMTAIVSAVLYSGGTCTLPEACAAAYSVPDGAPIAMAADNIGCVLSDGDAAQVATWQTAERAAIRKHGAK